MVWALELLGPMKDVEGSLHGAQRHEIPWRSQLMRRGFLTLSGAVLVTAAADPVEHLGLPVTITAKTGGGTKPLAIKANESAIAAVERFCNWNLMSVVASASQEFASLFPRGMTHSVTRWDDPRLARRCCCHWPKTRHGRRGTFCRLWRRKRLGHWWPTNPRRLLSLDDQMNVGLILAAWKDLGFNELDNPGSTHTLASDGHWDVLWSLMPQHGRSVDLAPFLGIPIDWSFYRSHLPSWDFARARADQTHNHCFTFHGAPVGPKHHLAISLRKLRDHLAASGSSLLANPEDECFAGLCFPESYIVMVGSKGLDEAETVTKKLSEKKEMVAKACHSSGGRSITILRSPGDLSNLLARAGHGTTFLVQRRIRSPLIEGRRFHFRLYAGLTSLHPLRVYVHHDDDDGGYAVLARKAASSSQSAESEKLVERGSCSHASGVCTPQQDEEFVTNYGDRQISQGEFARLYRNLTGADPDALLRRMHHNIVVMLLAAGHHSRHSDLFRRLQSLLGGARCFEILGVDFLFEEYEEIRGGQPHIAWAPYLVDVTPSPGYGRPKACTLPGPSVASSHRLLRDFFRTFVTGDPDPELRDHAPNNATDTVTEEDKWQVVSEKAASLGLEMRPEDRPFVRRLDVEANSRRWRRLFPPARDGLLALSFNYVPLFVGGPTREDALSMLWAGVPPEDLEDRGAFQKPVHLVDKVLNCFFERVGGHRISPSEEFVLTEGLTKIAMASADLSKLGGQQVVSNVPAFLVNFFSSGCAQSQVKLPALMRLLA
eukprot:s3855_g3.t8